MGQSPWFDGQMIHRAEDLRLVTDDHARRLWINRTRRGWRAKEPLDDRLPVETPRLLYRSVAALLSERVQSRAEILSALSLPLKDVEELACLPDGFLDEKFAPVTFRDFTKGRKQQPEPSEPSDPKEPRTSGEVVEFKAPKTRAIR